MKFDTNFPIKGGGLIFALGYMSGNMSFTYNFKETKTNELFHGTGEFMNSVSDISMSNCAQFDEGKQGGGKENTRFLLCHSLDINL